tara:strand:+ start:30 stop:419 length:390 start_codon:yes stop_codon:yes gene_type:complete
LSGTYGRGIFSVETRHHFEQLVELVDLVDNRFNFITHEFIENSFGRGIRLVILSGRVITTMKIKAVDGDFRTNVPRSGIGPVVEIDNEVEFSALEATKLMSLGNAGVDLLFNKDGYVIYEINSSPGFIH